MHIVIATLHVRASAQAVPLAAGCLKACLSPQLQKQTSLIDLFPEQDIPSACKQLLALNPSVIAFPLYLWNRERILELSRALRQQNPRLFLLAGGPEASADAQNVIQEGDLDAVICGEGDVSFAEVMARFSDGKTLSGIDGYVSASLNTGNSLSVAACPDLSALSSPWLTKQIPLQKHCGVLWETARGCLFNCAFCYDAKGHQGVRPLPFERLRKELELFKVKQVAQIWILDSTFNAPPERGRKLLSLLLEVAPEIHYHLEAKADFLDEETIELLSRLSCSVQIGLQSADPQVLKSLNRNLVPKQMKQKLRQMTLAGITFGLDLIYGLPGDNHRGFQQSLDFALQQQPNQVDLFPLAVLPGTELHQKQQEFGIQGMRKPPYLLQTNSGYPERDLDKSCLLAAATDIFYNRGRAVGFFLQICTALRTTPSIFLNRFCDWLLDRKKINRQAILDAENWQSPGILALQQQFVSWQLRSNNRTNLVDITEDLINYHFLCAETLLADDCLPGRRIPAKKNFGRLRWRLNPAVRIQGFHYELEELERVGGESLDFMFRKLKREHQYAIFLRQRGEVMTESLDDDFAMLLTAADGEKSGSQLFRGLDPESTEELLEFAVTQGLLLPVT